MVELTLQAYVEQQWVDVGLLQFPDGEHYDFRRVQFTYFNEYALQHLHRRDKFAVAYHFPVQMAVRAEATTWPTFLYNLIPSGRNREFWLTFLDIHALTKPQQDFYLLAKAAVVPLGHLRIKEAVPLPEHVVKPRRYALSQLTAHGAEFVDYVLKDLNKNKATKDQMLSTVAAALGAQSHHCRSFNVHVDESHTVWIGGSESNMQHLGSRRVVRCPRGERSSLEGDVLRAEFYFLQELAAMRFDTCDVNRMQLIEGQRYPLILQPAIDDKITEAGPEKVAIESLHSLLPHHRDAALRHEQLLAMLVSIFRQANESGAAPLVDIEGFVTEWVRRDLLKRILGYTESTIYVVRDSNSVRLAPIVECAPLQVLPNYTERQITWSAPLEVDGEFDFDAIAQALADFVHPDNLLMTLNITASRLVGLKHRLKKRGVPRQILESKVLRFDDVEQKLRQWKLLK